MDMGARFKALLEQTEGENNGTAKLVLSNGETFVTDSMIAVVTEPERKGKYRILINGGFSLNDTLNVYETFNHAFEEMLEEITQKTAHGLSVLLDIPEPLILDKLNEDIKEFKAALRKVELGND